MLYDIGFAIFSIFYLPALIFKGKLHGDFAERFGAYNADKRKALEAARGAIWIQAVSVGEVAVCKSLVSKLRAGFPNKKIIISTITKTGNELARKLFSKDAAIIYFPLDFSPVVKKVVAFIKPCMYIMIETEIWPNLLKELAGSGIPSILINGRISDASIGKYTLARSFLKNTLARVSRFCMQSGLDAERIISMGAPKERVSVTGNMKFDVDIKVDLKAMETLREALSLKADEELFVAGSTHRGEEKIVIESFKELLKDFPKLKLLIAPRHIERAAEVRNEARRAGLGETQVIVFDKIGYLNSAYSYATLVFVGGSLVKHGGQNPIEPAIFEKPILFGPHMFNFKDISMTFLKNNAAIQVSDKEELIKSAKLLLKEKGRRDEIGKLAKEVVEAGCGATERNIEMLKKYA
ncbi:MAG: 3-deoxy-D-manno-octulosonic acid transferase [Candidatus Omnitrophica bacterium]|nr:3-deoxy-D-manno-octulosonic acid transferase [Candidatus Omnitrophota bacterium]